MGLFRGSQVDKIVDAESDLELASELAGDRSREAIKARGRVIGARTAACLAENMQADYELATGDRHSREPYSGTRRLFK
jgi:hypothetical protein